MCKRYSSKASVLGLVLICCAGTLIGLTSGCAGRSAGSGFAGRLQTKDAGLEIEKQFGGPCACAGDHQRIHETTRRIAAVVPGLRVKCRCILLESEDLAALSLSDGRIYLTVGLYRKLDDEHLAAIIAHEMAHVVARDGKSPVSDEAAQLAREMRADKKACEYLAAAGYPASGLVEALQLVSELQPADWVEARLRAVSTHSQIGDSPPELIARSTLQ